MNDDTTVLPAVRPDSPNDEPEPRMSWLRLFLVTRGPVLRDLWTRMFYRKPKRPGRHRWGVALGTDAQRGQWLASVGRERDPAIGEAT